MTPENAAECYITHCKDRNLSPHSLICYGHALGWFVRALPAADFSEIAPATINSAWFTVAAAPALNANTLRLYRVILGSWLDWCVIHAGLPAHALRTIPLPKKTDPHRPKVSVQRLHALRAACARLEPEYIRLRAVALLEVLWSVLIRRGEVIVLRVAQLRLEDDPPQLFVECGKGGWTGWLPMSDEAAQALRAWLAVRGAEEHGGYPPHDWLWCNAGEKRVKMGLRALYHLLARLARIAGIAVEECKPHAVRRGSSTAMLQAGYDIGTVSKYLRHKSIQTTWDYVEASQVNLAEARNWMVEAERAKREEKDLKNALQEIRNYMAQSSPLSPSPKVEEPKSEPALPVKRAGRRLGPVRNKNRGGNT